MPKVESYQTVQIKDPDGKVVTVNMLESELKDYQAKGYQVPASIFSDLKKMNKAEEKGETIKPMHDGQMSEANPTEPPSGALPTHDNSRNEDPAQRPNTDDKKSEEAKPVAKTVQTNPPADQGVAAKK